MKKLLVILLLFAIFLKVIHHYNNKWNEDFFDEFYTYDYADTKEDKTSPWEKFKTYVKGLYAENFAGNGDEEKYIYK